MVATVGCSFDWDALAPRGDAAVTTTTASTGGAGGVGATAGFGGAAVTGGNGGIGGAAGGMGGSPLTALHDRGLTTRYYIDEAGSGRGPDELIDAAPDPLTLSLDYGSTAAPPIGGAGGTGGMMGTGGSEPNWSFTEVDGNRGLSSLVPHRSGGASAGLSAPKLQALDGATEATIECVVDFSVNRDASRISHLGVNSWGTLTLAAPSGELSFRLNGRVVEVWPITWENAGRGGGTLGAGHHSRRRRSRPRLHRRR